MTTRGLAFSGNERSASRWFAQQPGWWDEYFHEAAEQAVAFLQGDGIDLRGKTVIDLGCGDGIISLGLSRNAGAGEVIGLDLMPVDEAFLHEMAVLNDQAPPSSADHVWLDVSQPNRLLLPDACADIIFAWSVFEHVADPVGLLREVKRVLTTNGILFLQIWPLFSSENGSHLWAWFDQPFAQHRSSETAIDKHLQDRIGQPQLADAMKQLYGSCNRITVDELQTAIIDAGLFGAKVELQSEAFHVPEELQRVPISLLGLSGIKLLAVKR